MKFSTVFPVLAVAATVSASDCKPKSASASGDWSADPSATATGGWSSDTTATVTSGTYSVSTGSITGGWPSDPSGTAAPSLDANSDWTATVSGSVLPGPVTAYGSFVQPTGPAPTNSIPPFQTGGFNDSWSTSNDAQNNPGAPNSAEHRGCWGGGFDINTDYESSWPNTGNTKQFFLELTNTTMSPDGTPKEMLVVNGQYPGPLIECNWGDFLEITVKNSLTNNGTSFHWHGFRQFESNTEDGVNGITECPIAPGDQKTYRFQATSYGTTWYHSHHSIQYGDGVKGPVIVHGPASANYDIDLGTVTLDELYALTAPQEDWFAHRVGPPTGSNVLYNGQNIKPDLSAGERQKFNFQPGQKHLLRLINTAVDHMFSVQIDNHNLLVIANDFVPINPYVTQSLSIGIGQRYDVVIEANQDVDSYWFRAIPKQGNPAAGLGCCSNNNSGLDTANAIIEYSGASGTLPTSNYTTFSSACTDEPIASLVPIVTKTVDSGSFAAGASLLPANVQRTNVTGGGTVFSWFLNGISQDIDWENPSIAQAVAGNDSFPTQRDVIILPDEGVWTYWIIQNQFFVPHPMHLHGHDFSLLGQGNGTFDINANFDQLNFVNPTRRDVAMLVASGWTVIAFKTDNPGAWLMHCHIGWHVGEGLSLEFLEIPSKIPELYGNTVTGQQFQDTCANWKTYYDGNPAYNKTDSGLKRREELSQLQRHQSHSRHLHEHVRHARHHDRSLWDY